MVKFLRDLGGMPLNEDGIPVTIRVESVNPLVLKGHANKLNWKSHPERQQTYVEESIRGSGWARTIVFNANTMNMIDGHGRVDLAVDKGMKSVPVDVGWWTDEQEKALLVGLDNLGSMASVNAAALKSLTEAALRKVKDAKDRASVAQRELMRDVNAYSRSILEGAKDKINLRRAKGAVTGVLKAVNSVNDKGDDDDESQAIPEYRDSEISEEVFRKNIHFPSTNPWGLPDLDPKMFYKNTRIVPNDTFDRTGRSLTDRMYYCDASRPFDSTNHQKPVGGFLGFFTEDRVFEKYYEKPDHYVEKLIDEEWFAVLEPDFSTYWDWPLIKRQWAVYRSRWCVRYWQEAGIKCIPLIFVTPDIKRDAPWLYDTLPKGKCPIMAMQVRLGNKELLYDPATWELMAKCVEYCRDKLGLKYLIAYGSENLEKYMVGSIPDGVDYVMIEAFINKRKMSIRDKAKAARLKVD